MARTREFDLDDALTRAMHLFWERGYEGTSLEALTETLQINRPSLYAAFGNKRALFTQALDRYASEGHRRVEAALEAPDLRDAIRAYLMIFVETDPTSPAGCFMVNTALACGPGAEDVRLEVAQRRSEARALLLARLQRAKREGALPEGAKPADLAQYFATVANGLSVQGQSGATTPERRRSAELALLALPPASR